LPEVLVANLPAQPCRFNLWISVIFCKISSDAFLDTKGDIFSGG
jgi:hypothetical protein